MEKNFYKTRVLRILIGGELKEVFFKKVFKKLTLLYYLQGGGARGERGP